MTPSVTLFSWLLSSASHVASYLQYQLLANLPLFTNLRRLTITLLLPHDSTMGGDRWSNLNLELATGLSVKSSITRCKTLG